MKKLAKKSYLKKIIKKEIKYDSKNITRTMAYIGNVTVGYAPCGSKVSFASSLLSDKTKKELTT